MNYVSERAQMIAICREIFQLARKGKKTLKVPHLCATLYLRIARLGYNLLMTREGYQITWGKL